jgi:ribosomal-protein-alanine N-acetyltransferase
MVLGYLAAMREQAETACPPRLLTERLILSLPSEADAEDLRAYAQRNEDAHRAWSPPAPPDALTLGNALRRVRDARRQFEAGSHLRFWLRWRHEPSGPFVGAVTLYAIELGPFRCARVGYSLDQECQGRGLMTEALRAVIRHAFDTMQLHRLEASVIPTNERSVRVLERLGFLVEGYARKYLFINGQLRDHLLTSLSNPELEDAERFRQAGSVGDRSLGPEPPRAPSPSPGETPRPDPNDGRALDGTRRTQ